MLNILVAPVLLGMLTTSAYVLAQVSSDTKVPLGEAVGGFVFIAGLVWWLARKLQRIEDDVTSLRAELRSRPCQYKGCPVKKDDDDS